MVWVVIVAQRGRDEIPAYRPMPHVEISIEQGPRLHARQADDDARHVPDGRISPCLPHSVWSCRSEYSSHYRLRSSFDDDGVMDKSATMSKPAEQ